MRGCLPLLVILACNDAEPDATEGPYGLPLIADGITYAGAAVIDITPEIGETFTDLDEDATFDGCLDDPAGMGPDCPEPFDDLDGDGVFEPVWIGGFGEKRPALGVREDDGISVRAVVIAHDGEYVALAAADLIGLGHNRLEAAAALLEADGFEPHRFLGGSTHNHQGPDSLGLWGDPLAGVSGYDPAYQDRIVAAFAEAVKQAASAAQPVDLKVGAVPMRERSVWFNGAAFGGKNPTEKMHGMVHDIRDPVIVSDQVLAMQGVADDDSVVFTFTNWSGHPEVRGDENNLLSSDWVGITRDILEDRYGGVAVHLPESLGGMQSAFGGNLPLVTPEGEHVFQICTVEAVADPEDDECFAAVVGDERIDADGDAVPVWATRHSWEFTISHGWHIAEAAIDVLEAAETTTAAPIRIEYEDAWVPVHNVAYNLLGPQGIFDIPLDQAATDSALCPAISDGILGCLPFRTSRLQIGPVTFVTAPGELLPELSWGLPTDDPLWVTEAADPAKRGPDSRYFPQHDNDCETTLGSFDECLESEAEGDCNCLAIHTWPYVISSDSSHRPVLEDVDTPYKATLSATQQYLSYIIPDTDVNRYVSLFTDDGDHYEDTVTMSWDFAPIYLEAQGRISERW